MCASVVLAACSDAPEDDGVVDETPDDGETVKGSVSNTTETFSFLKDITVNANATFVVSKDIYCEQIIVSKSVKLEIGDNEFYILVTNGNEQALYVVTVRRLPMYSVTFDSDGGTPVESQAVEEGGLATEPIALTRAGYTFSGWSYDFTKPVMGDTTVTALWTAHGDTKYVVEYYLENLTKTDYELKETVNLTGTTDATATAEVKTFEHFTYNELKSEVSGNIAGDGTLVLKVYYTRDTYTVKASSTNATVSGGYLSLRYESNDFSHTNTSWLRVFRNLLGRDRAH